MVVGLNWIRAIASVPRACVHAASLFAFVAVTLDVLAVIAEVSRGAEALGAHQTAVDTCCLYAILRLVDIVAGLCL